MLGSIEELRTAVVQIGFGNLLAASTVSASDVLTMCRLVCVLKFVGRCIFWAMSDLGEVRGGLAGM